MVASSSISSRRAIAPIVVGRPARTGALNLALALRRDSLIPPYGIVRSMTSYRISRRRTAVVVLGWLAAALVATLGGIRLVSESLTGTPGGVLSQDDVARALEQAGPAPVTASSPTPS